MKLLNVLKIIAGTLVVAGLVLSFFERKNAPILIAADPSPNYPEWLSSVGWWVPAIAALGYVVIDIVAIWASKGRKKESE